MRLKFKRRYGSWMARKTYDVPDHLAPAMVPKFAAVVEPTTQEVEETLDYRCLQLMARHVGVPANQKRAPLKAQIIETVSSSG